MQVLHALVDDLQRVEQRGEHDDRGAVLVVVEDRDVQPLLQPVLDLEAARRRDVLEVDAAEARRDRRDRLDDLVGVLGVQADREPVDAGELLEEHRLALHDRHRRARADVAEPQHRRAVGHHGHRVALDRVAKRVLGRVVDRAADARHAGRVGHREVVPGAQRRLVVHLDLAADVQAEGPVDGLDDLHALDGPDRGEDPVLGLAARRVEGDVAHDDVGPDLHDVDGLDQSARLPDRHRDVAEHPQPVGDLDADGEGVLRGRGGHGPTESMWGPRPTGCGSTGRRSAGTVWLWDG